MAHIPGGRLLVFAGLSLALLLTGCGGGTTATRPPEGLTQADQPPADILEVGDLLQISYAGLSTPMPPHEERIKEDGTVTPPYIGPVKAAGRNSTELQKEIQSLYSRLYKTLVVTVNPGERFFFVNGEVKLPNRYTYSGQQSVLKAITTAGGFTDYADRKKVMLTRKNGRQLPVDCRAAQKDARLDLPVYPGDRIDVPRRFY